MTLKYLPVLEETLQEKYPEPASHEQLSIENIRFKLFLPKTTLIFSAYSMLKTLSITHCDLRNLENFPKLAHLQELDLGFNQIQGTFNHLIPLKRLKYLNIQDNIVFESNKFAPLKKIASANRFSNQSSTNSLKISICLRNNPFADQQTSYINKLKGFGLKVVKEPKEYFDKKKSDQDKVNRSNKKNQNNSGKKKNKKGTAQNQKDKKIKRQDHEELDSFYSGESIILESSSSSSSDDDDNNNNNNNNPNRSIMMSNDSISRSYQRVSRMSIDNSMRPSLTMRISDESSRLENPFISNDELNIGSNGLILMDEISDDSEEINQNRFQDEQEMNERSRILENRRMRLQELRGMRRGLSLQRERERLERLREIERREHARGLERTRQLEQERQRLLNRTSAANIFGGIRNSNSSNSNDADDQWRVNPFRRRPSGIIGSGLIAAISNSSSNANSNNNNSGNNDNNNANNNSNGMGLIERNSDGSISISRYLQQMRNGQRANSGLSNDPPLVSPIYQPLRVRQSSDLPMIRLSRMQSYHSQSSNANANQRYSFSISRQLPNSNRESQVLRFMNDSDDYGNEDNDDQENDIENEDEENQLNDDDDDDIDQMIEDDNDDNDQDDDEGVLHVCNEGCEHNADDNEDEDDPENDQNDEDDLDNQMNQEEEDSSQNNGLMFPRMANHDVDFADFMMINDEMVDIGVNDWSMNPQSQQNAFIRAALSRNGNPSLSSNQNPDSESRLEHQGDEDEEEESEQEEL